MERYSPDAVEGTGGPGFDAWDALRLVTQETRASLVADVVGHPMGSPTVAELDYLNPGVGRSAIAEHLRKLVDAGVLERNELPPGERSRDLPYTFYSLTDEARALFDRSGIFDRDVWATQYAKVEKTAEVERIESMERPGDG
jgi:DNA-binding transcriptional ArsR family regulator